MKRLLIGFFSATFLALCAVPANSADEVPSVPKRFKAFIGGFVGASYTVELRADGTLEYSTRKRGREEAAPLRIAPTPADWREFRVALEAIDVWKWKARYGDEGLFDGTQWSLEIAFGDHAVKSEGSNSYPDAPGATAGQPGTTAPFDRYLAAMKKLLGDRDFE